MEMTPFFILRKALLGVAKLGDKHQIWCLCQIVIFTTLLLPPLVLLGVPSSTYCSQR